MTCRQVLNFCRINGCRGQQHMIFLWLISVRGQSLVPLNLLVEFLRSRCHVYCWLATLDRKRCCRDNAGVHRGERCFSSLADVALCNVYITCPADGVYLAVAVGGAETCVPLWSWLEICVDARPARCVLCGHSASMAIYVALRRFQPTLARFPHQQEICSCGLQD